MRNGKFEDKVSMPKLTEKNINLRGCRLLAAAILLAAAQDYYKVCDKNLNDSPPEERYDDFKNVASNALKTRAMLELFFQSTLFDAISDIPGDVFQSRIQKMKSEGRTFPSLNDYESRRNYKKKGAQLPMQYSSHKIRRNHTSI